MTRLHTDELVEVYCRVGETIKEQLERCQQIIKLLDCGAVLMFREQGKKMAVQKGIDYDTALDIWQHLEKFEYVS